MKASAFVYQIRLALIRVLFFDIWPKERWQKIPGFTFFPDKHKWGKARGGGGIFILIVKLWNFFLKSVSRALCEPKFNFLSHFHCWAIRALSPSSRRQTSVAQAVTKAVLGKQKEVFNNKIIVVYNICLIPSFENGSDQLIVTLYTLHTYISIPLYTNSWSEPFSSHTL